MASKNVIELTQDNWQSQVLDNPLPVLVDFWAVWCGPCVRLTPTIEALADEYAGKVVVGKLNVEDSQDIAAQFRITTIPQVYVFKGGQVVDRLTGLQPKTAYTAALEKALA
jgi:thioredoxin 1